MAEPKTGDSAASVPEKAQSGSEEPPCALIAKLSLNRGFCSLEQEFAVIEEALAETWECPNTKAQMVAYTCVYNLCSRRGKQGTEAKQAVYEKHREEVSRCIRWMEDSMARYREHPEELKQTAEFWGRLQRRFSILQMVFGFLDRYYVPSLNIACLQDVKAASLIDAGVAEQARQLWQQVATGIQRHRLRISSQALHELCAAWHDLARVTGVEAPMINALREHLIATLSTGRASVQRSSQTDACHGRAAQIMLQPPLIRLIVDHMSEHDLCDMYSVKKKFA